MPRGKTYDSAAQAIACGRANLVLTGGTEAMSHAPLLWSKAMVTWLGNLTMARDIGSRVKAIGRFRPALLKPVIAPRTFQTRYCPVAWPY